MKTILTHKHILSVLMLLLIFTASFVKAQTTFTGAGNWSTPANWSAGVPGAGTAATIAAGKSCTVDIPGAVCGSLTISAGATTVAIGAGEGLSIAGSFTNSGTFNAPAGTTLTFNSAGAKSIISGGGAYTIAANVVMNLGAKTDTLDVTDPNFITGINSGGLYYFTFTQGTWKMDAALGAVTLNDCYNNGANAGNGWPLTIPFPVVIEVDFGPTMNLALKGTCPGVANTTTQYASSYVVLSGKLFVNGGTVNVMTGQVANSGYDFRYLVNGGTPQLYVAGGNLNIGAGFGPYTGSNDITDYIDFNMSGGTIIGAFSSYSYSATFQISNVVGSITTMTAGTVILRQGVMGYFADVDFGGPNISPFTVVGGTIQFGDALTNGNTWFAFQAYATTHYPNMVINASQPNKLQPMNPGSFGLYSINIGPGCEFIADDYYNHWYNHVYPNYINMNIDGSDGTNAFYNNNGTFTPANSTVSFNGSMTQVINGTAAAQTFYNVLINGFSSATTKCGGPVTTLNCQDFTVTQGIFSPGTCTTMNISGNVLLSAGTGSMYNAPATINASGNWTNNGGGFTPGTGTVNLNGAGMNINGTAATQTFYNLTANNTTTISGSTATLNISNDFTETAGTFTGPAPFTLNIGRDFLLNAGTFTATAASNVNVSRNWSWTSGALFNPSTGTVTFNGTSNQLIEGNQDPQTFNNLIVNNTGAGASLSYSGPNTVTVNGRLTMSNGIFIVGNTNILNGTGKITATGGDLQIATTGTTEPELTGAYTITGGTVTLNGPGAQTLQPSCSTYYNLVFTNSGTKTITAFAPWLAINGNCTVSGSATIPNNNSQINQAAAKTFYYNSTGATTLNNGVLATLGSYSQNMAGGTFADGGGILTIAGATFTVTAGTFTSTGTEIFKGAIAQTLTAPGISFNNLTLNNNNGLTINNDVTVSNTLLFTHGKITTGANNMIITSTGTVSDPGNVGWVIGNEKKWLAVGAPTAMTFELGATYFSSINLSATVTAPGYLTCRFTEAQDPYLASSMINASSDVIGYWDIANTSATITTYGATFNFNTNDIEGGAVPASFQIQDYNGVSWSNTTVQNQFANSTSFINQAAFGEFAIGNTVQSTGIYNAVTGAFNWNNQAHWIQCQPGTISCTIGNTTVTGTGTSFTSNLPGGTGVAVGDWILSQSQPGTPIGQVKTVTNDNLLILQAGAAIAVNGGYGREVVPGVNDAVNIGTQDIVNIGNANVAGSATVTYDLASTSIFALVFTPSMAVGNTVTQSGANSLTVTQNVTVGQPNSGNINKWLINNAPAVVNGSLYIGSGDGTAGHNAYVGLTNGTLTIGTDLVFNSSVAPCVELDLSGGAGTVNLDEQLKLASTGAFLNPGSSGSNFNYTRTTGSAWIPEQYVIMQTSSITYDNILINATYGMGAGLTGATTGDIAGNLLIQHGTLHDSAFAITGTAGNTFSVSSLGATFEMSGAGTYPTGFSTYTFGATSNTQYHQTNALTVSAVASPGYGNLDLESAANTVTFTLPAGTTFVQGNLNLGNGTNTGESIDAFTNSPTLTVTGNLTLNANTTLNANSTNPINIYGNWTNNGGTFTPNNGTVNFNGTANQFINGSPLAQTFYNLTIGEAAAAILTTGGSTITLNVNSITLNTGNFNAPATLNITNNLTLAATSGVFNAAANINIGGNWTENNGCTFNPNGGTITFNGTANQKIQGSIPTEGYWNFVIANTGAAGNNTVDASSFANLSTQNFTQNAGNFTSPIIFYINGIFTQNAGTFLIDNGYNLYVGGNWLYNGGTLTINPTSQITLDGTSGQTIGGALTFPTSIPNLIINNTSVPSISAITLNTPITVTTLLKLTDGDIVTNQTNLLTLDGASVTYSATPDSSFVDGPVVQTININSSPVTKTFPVGKINHSMRADLTVTQAAGAAKTYYNCEFIHTPSSSLGFTLPASLSKVSDCGYWNIFKTPTGTGITNGSIKLYYGYEFNAPDPTNLRVAMAPATPWVNYGGTGSAPIAPYQGTITSTIPYTWVGYFTIANATGGTNPLPIELLYFTAQCENNQAKLKWATASETNNDYFSIEKSHNGLTFENIGTISGAGNSNSLLNYSFSDAEPYSDISYYRLKQTDFNGNFTYSNIATSSCSTEDQMSMIVTQSDYGVNVFITPGSDKNLALSIFDISGKMMFYKHINTIDNPLTLNPTIFTEGIYIFRLQSETEDVVKKAFIK
ncbi:MAG: hypothetical protein ABR968_07755 [Bacteroidales bacterium]